MPMSILCLVLTDNIAVALNPAVVIGAILRVPLKYIIVWLLALGTAGIFYALDRLLGWMPVPVLDVVLKNTLALYMLFVVGRVLGLLYYTSSEKLDWIGG